MEINTESLAQAIEEFNHWEKAARIYIDTNDGYFETSVYGSDLQMTETMSEDNFIALYSKDEVEGNLHISEKRKAYIIKYAQLILDGWEPHQANYEMLKEYV